MIAYLITAYNEFDAVADLVSRLYDPRDFYCICVTSNNTGAISEALDELNGLSGLPNVRIIGPPAAPHGGILENLLIAIDFCLKFEPAWQSLIFLTGGHIAITPPSAIRERVSQQFRDKIVLEVGEHPREFTADSEIVERLFDDPFRREAKQNRDNAQYNPFTYTRFALKRAGTSYFIRPGAMRVGWSRSSHFVGNLFPRTFVPERNEVHIDRQPPMMRRLLEKFFQDRPMSACLAWGILPRDFCEFCLNSLDAQTYFALIHNCFAAEEPFFATLALDPLFRARIIKSNIVINAPRAENILTMEDVDEALARGRLFARKAPAGESGREFRTEIYARLGIPLQLDIARLCKPPATGYRERLSELLRRYLRFAGTRFTMGIFGERQLAQFTILPDLTLEYQEDTLERKEPAGRQWRWREGGYDAFSANGDPVGRFDGFRIHGGRFFVFGYWPWAEPLTLACVADVTAMLPDPPSSPVLPATDGLGQVHLNETAWSFWSSDREVAAIAFHPDGTIRRAEDAAAAAGHWRVADGCLLAFGLDDMPVALFDQIGGGDGKWHLAGVTSGRQSPVEPCTLVPVARPPSTQSRDDSGAAMPGDIGRIDPRSVQTMPAMPRRPETKKPVGSEPRIIAISMVKNEQDVIEPCILHNMQYLDAFIIIDNGSTDDTRRIITDVMREIPGVVLADISGFAFTQQQRMTRLLHYCQTAYFADFVLFIDADEFIDVKDRATFVENLKTIPKGGYGNVLWKTFVVTPATLPAAMADPPRSLRWRRTEETTQTFKAFLNAAREPCLDLIVTQGNHHIASNSGKPVPEVLLREIRLAHFPVRSSAQMTAKSVINWMAILAKGPWDGSVYQLKVNFDALCQGVRPEGERLAEIAMRYAQDKTTIDWAHDVVPEDPPADYSRTHSTGAFADPVILIGRAWERSLAPPPPLLSLSRPQTSEAMSASIAATVTKASWHWDNLFVDIPPLRWIVEKHQPASALDIGCGIGAYLVLMRRLGVKTVFGIDGIPGQVTALEPGEYRAGDLGREINLGARFDLVLCTEVAEHIADGDAETLLGNIARHATGLIVFSAAEPGQPGHGHINCRPIGEWLRRWQALGWTPDVADSLGMRALATFSWFRRNLVVLKPGLDNGEEAIRSLEVIGGKPFGWYGQSPGIREELCTEDLPPRAGYEIAVRPEISPASAVLPMERTPMAHPAESNPARDELLENWPHSTEVGARRSGQSFELFSRADFGYGFVGWSFASDRLVKLSFDQLEVPKAPYGRHHDAFFGLILDFPMRDGRFTRVGLCSSDLAPSRRKYPAPKWGKAGDPDRYMPIEITAETIVDLSQYRPADCAGPALVSVGIQNLGPGFAASGHIVEIRSGSGSPGRAPTVNGSGHAALASKAAAGAEMRGTQPSIYQIASETAANKPASYLPVYEQLFEPMRAKPLSMLELGVSYGGSIKAWEAYFPHARIAGVDLTVPAVSVGDRVRLFAGDQSDIALLSRVAAEVAPDGFDIIIDDASHVGAPTKDSFWHLFDQHLKPGGLYCIEDWGTGYWPTWPDGRKVVVEPDTADRMPSHDAGMVGFIKQLVDELSVADIKEDFDAPEPRQSKFSEMLLHRGMCVVRKTPG